MPQKHRQLNQPTRLGVFVFYDPQGVVDRYVDYLLRDLSENLTDLVIVCNGELSVEGEALLRQYTKRLYFRENIGFDAAAWKAAMAEYLGWDKIARYDELVLFNDTFFGPFIPFSEIFETMARREVDFWGITGHGRVDDGKLPKCPYPYIPAHIQSYFCVVRRAMHTSPAFLHYWETQPVFQSFSEVVGGNEATFTQHFADLGFRWATYVDSADLDTKTPCNQSILMPYDLLRRGCPILKRKCFSTYQAFHDGKLLNTQTERALRYVRSETDYPVELIYETILRLYNIAEIYDNLHLNYILPTEHTMPSTDEHCRTAMVLQVNDLHRLDNKIACVQSIPQWIDLIVLTDTEEKASQLRSQLSAVSHLQLLVVSSHASVTEFLLSAEGPCVSGQYELLCVCSDVNSSSGLFGKSIEENRWGSLLASGAYVENLVSCFSDNPRLGLLVPPWPFAEPGNQMWADSFENVRRLAERFQITAPISQSKPSLSLGMSFWCRTAALAPLFSADWKQERIGKGPPKTDSSLEDVVGRLLPFAAQQSGYYTGWVMPPELASAMLCDLRESAVSGNWRIFIKNTLRKRLPPRMWQCCRRIYHIFR